MRSCQHSDVLSRPAELSVELIVGVHPDRWQALHDRMLRVARSHLERQTRSVLSGGPRGRIGDQLAILPIPIGPCLLVTVPPAANSGHLVVGRPIGKGVIGGVHNHKPSAVCSRTFQTAARKLRRPARDRRSSSRSPGSGSNCGLKLLKSPSDGGAVITVTSNRPGLFQFRLQNRSRQSPVVKSAGALTVDNRDTNHAGTRACRPCPKQNNKQLRSNSIRFMDFSSIAATMAACANHQLFPAEIVPAPASTPLPPSRSFPPTAHPRPRAASR